MPVLEDRVVAAKMKSFPSWSLEQGELVRHCEFHNFVEAMHFVNSVAEMAEGAGHHPDIDIRYNKVRLALISHDAGGLTERDFDLAAADRQPRLSALAQDGGCPQRTGAAQLLSLVLVSSCRGLFTRLRGAAADPKVPCDSRAPRQGHRPGRTLR
jgi:4a-hydroxytetrahydrobiopterin dehydratase